MKTNTAAVAAGCFSDAWDDETPTVVDRWVLLPGKTAPLAKRTDAYAAMSDTGIRAAFRCDTGSTCQDLTAVSS